MEGKIFENIEDAEKFISDYCKERHHPVRLESRTSVGQFNKKTKKDICQIPLPDTHTYSIRWVCKHFGAEKVCFAISFL